MSRTNNAILWFLAGFFIFVYSIGFLLMSNQQNESTGASNNDFYEGGVLGHPSVYARIATTTDCAELQDGFNRAEEHGLRNRQIGNLQLAEISTAYMIAYDERMHEIGCYE